MDRPQHPRDLSPSSSPPSRSGRPRYTPSTPIELDQREYFMEHDQKKLVTETVRPVSSDDSDHEHDTEKQPNDPRWQPGFFNQFPVLGFGALLTAILCAVGSVVTLLVSNGKSQTHWPEKLAPNVILSGLNSVANICYGIAIANGIAIAWWRQALKGATIKQLHTSWSFGSSLKSIAMAGKYFNVIALAALTTKLTIVDNMLMQRATSTTIYLDGPLYMHNITMYANDSIPQTGSIQGRGGSSSFLDTNLNMDLILWQQNGGQVRASGNGTQGIYFLNVSAAGFEIDCTAPVTTPINYAVETQNATIYASNHNGSMGNSTLQFSPTLFSLKFDVESTGGYDENGNPEPGAYSYLKMNVVSTSANDTDANMCPGTKTTQSCTLRPAVVQYPVLVQNATTQNTQALTSAGGFFTSTLLTFDTESDYFFTDDDGPQFGVYNRSIKQSNGYEVLSYKNIFEDAEIAGAGSTSTLGGLQEAFTQYLGGSASILFGGAVGFEVTETGNAQQYLTQVPKSVTDQCGYQYLDPINIDIWTTPWVMNSVMTSINQIMFTLATDGYYSSNPDNPPAAIRNATLYQETVHYETHEAYMWGAVASMLVCVILILPAYYGYWQLGRKVSLGPFEIAHAFRSPMTAAGSNGTIDELIKEVGHNKVQYGQIVKGDAKGVLGIAEPDNVARVYPSIGSARGEIQEKMHQTFGRVATR